MKDSERVFNEAKRLSFKQKIKLLFSIREKTVPKEIKIIFPKKRKSANNGEHKRNIEIDNILDLSIDDIDDINLLVPDEVLDKYIDEDDALLSVNNNNANNSSDEEEELIRDTTQGLPCFIFPENKKISEVDKMVLYKPRTCFEKIKMIIDKEDVKGTKNKNFRYKDTDCVLHIEENIPIFADDFESELNIIITRPDKYYRNGSDPREFPIECKAILDDENLSLFKKFTDLRELIDAIETFDRLTPKQQLFIKKQSKKPAVIKKNDSKKTFFVPIQDQEALEMMYRICRETYPVEIQSKVDRLLGKLHSHRYSGESEADILTQISYALCIDTDAIIRPKKSYDEIMTIFNKHVYGMKDLKERIAEYILAMQYSKSNYFCILLVGSPGVGKTSVCDAISEIIGCELANVDCSGTDVVGLCGLVKSFGGAQPSKISNAFVTKGKTDLLLRLDEIDKLVRDKNGDAFSALIKPFGLQRAFHDEYLDGDIDMSNTKVICTANDISKIPGYIINRFGDNIFVLPDYTVEDKIQIAKNYVIPKKLNEYKIKANELEITDEALFQVATKLCHDEGAREITSHIESLIRKAIKGWSVGSDSKPLIIDVDYVNTHLKHNTKSAKTIGFIQ